MITPTPRPAIAPARIPNKASTAALVRSDLLAFMGTCLTVRLESLEGRTGPSEDAGFEPNDGWKVAQQLDLAWIKFLGISFC